MRQKIEEARLGEVCEINIGRTPARNQPKYWNGSNPWLAIADMGKGRAISRTKEQITQAAIDECNCRPVEAGTVLLSFKLSIGKVGIAQRRIFTNEAIAALPIRDSTKVAPEFLYWALQSLDLKAGLDRAAKGLTLNKAKLQLLRIPLPPLADQRRIAAVLDKADELRAKRRAALTKLDTLTQSIFLEMFGDPATNPKKWSRTTLGEVASQKPNNGIFKKNHEYSGETTNTLPVVWVEELFRGDSLDTNSSRRLIATTSEVKKYGLHYGDILFCRSSLKLDGIAYNNVYEGDDEGALFECHIIRLRPDQRVIDPVFLNVLMRTPAMRRIAKSKAKTATMTTIDQQNLSAIQIPLPPLKLQQEFVTRFGEIRRLRMRMEKSLAEMKNLFACLQWHAFHGQLSKAHA